MAFLTENEKASLEAKISHAESQTSAEIVTVIARKSDGYRYIPFLWAALLALSVPGIYYAYLAATTGGWVESDYLTAASTWLYPVQVLVFLGLGMVFQIPAARMAIIPASVKRQRAARHAREQFFLQNLHQTQGNTGVLIFVSVAEHYVEIIVDSAIASAVDDELWKQTVDDFIGHVRHRDIAKGFDHTIEQCREILWKHFPVVDSQLADDQQMDERPIEVQSTGTDGRPAERRPTDGRPNELPNHLIEV